MKQKRYKWIAVVAIVVAVVGGWVTWQRSREPRYEGKTVRQWIETAQSDAKRSTNRQMRFTHDFDLNGLHRMLDALGTNAAPLLIQILVDGDSMVTEFKIAIYRSKWIANSIRGLVAGGIPDSLKTLSMAGQGISYLGSNAVHLIPELKRITCDEKKTLGALVATDTLGRLGLQALPALQRSLTNAPSSQQQMIRIAIQDLYTEALKSEDAREREDAALALSEYPRPPSEIVWVLLEMLNEPNTQRQKQSLNALATHLPTMAPSLVAGYRAVEKLTNSQDAEVHRVATELLSKLPEPDPSKKP